MRLRTFLERRAGLPVLIAQGSGGSGSHIDSTVRLGRRPSLAWSYASKLIVNIAVLSVAPQLGRDNILGNWACQVTRGGGPVEAFLGLPRMPENRQMVHASIPVRQMRLLVDIANVCRWLVEDASIILAGILSPVDLDGSGS